MTTTKFELGQMVMTGGVAAETETNPSFGQHVHKSLVRHAMGDWGDLSAEDVAENEYALGKHL